MKLAQKLVIGYYRTRLRLLSALSNRKAAESAFRLFCTPMRRSKRKTPSVFAKSKPFQLLVDDCTIKGNTWENPGAKKILIVHGFESSSKNFDSYISLLLDKGYGVTVFDAPAHGLSSGKRINVPLFVKTITEINELLGPFDGYIAHSFGALALSHFLESVPHDESTHMVLIAPATETVTTINSFFSFLRLPAAVRIEFDKLIFQLSGFNPEYFSVRRALKNIRAKVLWFHDEEDELTPVEDALKAKEDGLPHVRFRITKGLGHRRIYRDHGIVMEVTEFL